ncbi:hypothetical protein SAMN05216214_109165 [Atopomonas hussainii]|uniref:Uncharacterized protein n=1 Tax=Atopomonas hussainii TaxID=1429083 RepID=A0A1H7NJP8_9GAMM|nr:hypothetical protein [Atopomonas hussainii]SEL23228.1 hypothetical protein SAMN05216214_109165 [Atopomonas hussainii]
MQLVERFQLFANSPELKTAERKERYKQVLAFMQRLYGPSDADMVRHLKHTYFTGEVVRLAPGQKLLSPPYQGFYRSQAFMAAALSAPEVTQAYLDECFAQLEIFPGVLPQLSAHYYQWVMGGGLINYPLLSDAWQELIKFAERHDAFKSIKGGDALKKFFHSIVYFNPASLVAIEPLLNYFSLRFDFSVLSSSTADALIRFMVPALRGDLIEGGPEVYEHPAVLRFFTLLLSGELPEPFLSFCREHYDALPADQRVTFDGKRLLLPAQQ